MYTPTGKYQSNSAHVMHTYNAAITSIGPKVSHRNSECEGKY